MVSFLVTDLFSGSAAGVAGYFSWSRLVVGESTSGGYRLSLATVVHVDECFVFKADRFEGRGASSHKRGENRRLVKERKKERKKKKKWPCLQVDVQREGNGFVATLRPLPLDEKSRVELRRDHTPSSTYRSALLSSGTVD